MKSLSFEIELLWPSMIKMNNSEFDMIMEFFSQNPINSTPLFNSLIQKYYTK